MSDNAQQERCPPKHLMFHKYNVNELLLIIINNYNRLFIFVVFVFFCVSFGMWRRTDILIFPLVVNLNDIFREDCEGNEMKEF